MEILGSLTVSAVVALFAAFLTQAVKQAIDEKWHRFIPLPLAGVTVVAGVVLAYLQGADLVQGGIEGFVGAALAVYGYEFVKNVMGARV